MREQVLNMEKKPTSSCFHFFYGTYKLYDKIDENEKCF